MHEGARTHVLKCTHGLGDVVRPANLMQGTSESLNRWEFLSVPPFAAAAAAAAAPVFPAAAVQQGMRQFLFIVGKQQLDTP